MAIKNTNLSPLLKEGTGIALTSAGQVITITSTGAGALPAGSDTQVQFNDAGVLGADAGLTYNKTLNILGLEAIDFAVTPTAGTAERRLLWDNDEGSLNLTLKGGATNIALGAEVAIMSYNAEATTLNKGEVVYLYGAQGQRPSVKRAVNTSDATSATTFGMVAESIASGATGFIMQMGIVRNIDTNAYNEGDILYLGSTAGSVTTTKPSAPAHMVFVGVVLKKNASSGRIFVKPQNGYELDEIHNVAISSVANNDLLVYESSSTLWKNKSISTILGYTPEQPLTFSSPLSRSTNTISIPVATSLANGYLSSSDFATFSGKQNALSGTGIVKSTSGTISYLTDNSANWDTAYTNRITSLTTTGSSGASTLVSNTLNIPNYTLAGLGGFANPMTTLGDIIYQNASSATRLAGSTSASKVFLSQTGTGTASAAPAWSAVSKSDVGLGSVENTALSTWAGSTNITTLGTIATGTWSASTIAVDKGGTGATTLTGVVIGSGTSAFTAVAGTASQLLRRNAGNTAYEFFTPTYLISAITSLGGLTASTQTFANDTNVTITSATSTHTLGWSGQLAVSRGGTGLSALGTANQLIRVNAGATALEYFTPSYLTSAITSLGGLTGATQTFATGTSGTDFNISSATTTHTFNIPTASATNRGLLSTTDWTSFNNKLSTAITSLGGLTASTQTFANDTNVTITSATSTHTLGWTGQLSVGRGGTGASTLTGVLIGNGTSAVTAITGTASQLLRRNAGNTAYEFFTFSGMTNPMTTLGDLVYEDSTPAPARLAGNITTTKQYLSQTGTGTISAVPAWSAIAGSDVTGAALTKTDDTNVTLTLGGTPATSLLRSASLTLGWTGQLAISRGGTNSTATPTNGGVSYGTGTAYAFTSAGTSGQALVSAGASAPTWTTLTLENLPGAWVKKAVDCATTTALTINTAQTTIDGVTISASSRVLVKDQATASQNGIYTNLTTTTWVRATDADTSAEIASAMVGVDAGTINGGLTYDTDFKTTDTLGTTSMTWNRVIDTGYTIPTTQGGTGLTTIGSALQVLRVNSGGTALEYATISSGGLTGSGTANTIAKFNGASSITDSSITDTGSLITLNAVTYINSQIYNSAFYATNTTASFSASTWAGVSAAYESNFVLNYSSSSYTITAGNHYISFPINTRTVVEASSGTHNLFANVGIKALTLNNGVATTTNAATLYVEGATTGTATITNNYALWIDDGITRLDGTAIINGADATTNSVKSAGYFQGSLTTGTPAVGIGTSFAFNTQTGASNYELGSVISSISTNVTSTTEAFDLAFANMTGGATATERMRLKSTGQLQLNAYTSASAFTGTPLAALMTNSTGNVLSVEPVLQVTNLTISATAVQGAFTTPITLIAAQGAGKVILPVAFIFKLDSAGTAFATNTNYQFQIGTTAIGASRSFAGTTDAFTIEPVSALVATAVANLQNQALVWKVLVGNPTGGTGATISIGCVYSVLTI